MWCVWMCACVYHSSSISVEKFMRWQNECEMCAQHVYLVASVFFCPFLSRKREKICAMCGHLFYVFHFQVRNVEWNLHMNIKMRPHSQLLVTKFTRTHTFRFFCLSFALFAKIYLLWIYFDLTWTSVKIYHFRWMNCVSEQRRRGTERRMKCDNIKNDRVH